MKRVFDFTAAIVGLIILSPVFFITILAVKLDSPGPVFFRQRRIGQNEKEFMIIKFRTMRQDTPADVPTHLMSNEAMITQVGRLLRKTSLDELPQLLNVVKGEMSLVGPRPALYNQDDLIEGRRQLGVNDLVPGITGWAQINGRDEISIPEKVQLDYEYSLQRSFWWDIKILLLTVLYAVKGHGVKQGLGE